MAIVNLKSRNKNRNTEMTWISIATQYKFSPRFLFKLCLTTRIIHFFVVLNDFDKCYPSRASQNIDVTKQIVPV